MKHNLIYCILILFSSCSAKVHPVFKEKQQLYYSHSWEQLNNYSLKSGRNDDLHFFNPERGFVINSQGNLLLTEDGGENWETKFKREKTFFRCLTFKDSLTGWLGTIGTGDNALRSIDTVALYETFDGGENWNPVTFEGPYPKGLCGLQKVSDQVIVGCGRVRGPSFFIKTTDGGRNWKSYDLNYLAGSLIAPYFYDEQHGILIGGTTTDKKNCKSLVLETFDGGMSWDTIYTSSQKGEYCWKISFPSEHLGFISIQRNVKDGRFYFLQTNDGGKTWFENEYIDEYYYVQGVGFINEKIGWLGGSGRWTMETRDGGNTWKAMADVGRGFNNFQFFGDSLAYGVGYGVYKMKNLKPFLNGQIEKEYENGNRSSSISYKNGLQNGMTKYYFENGTLESIGQLKNNLRTGTWQFFTKDGKASHKLKFKNGRTKVSKKTMESFAGTYKIEENVYRIITYQKGKLYSKHSASEETYEIIPISVTTFIYEFNARTKIKFVRDNTGKVTHHIMTSNREETRAEKVGLN